MNPFNTMDRRKKIIAFSLVLLATVALEFILIAALWNKDEIVAPAIAPVKIPVKAPARYDILLAANETLAGRLSAIQQSDKLYNGLLTETTDKKRLDSVSQRINLQEESLRGSIDSAFLTIPQQSDSVLIKLVSNTIGAYRSILQNRQAMAGLRNAINLDKKNLSPDEMAVLKTQNELQEKSNRIASLEATLKTMATVKVNNKLPKTEDITAENIPELKGNIGAQEARIAALTALYNNLKEDNEKLLKLQNETPKATAGVTETLLKNKAASLQQRVDALNAELSLAQVDCNLSRVDAAQIISNSKQRKQLLTEASGILTSMANSDDAVIKKKVQDKILRLNQVAANSRD